MTKQDIIRQLIKHSDLTPAQATHAVEGIIEILTDAIVVNDPVMLRGFGTLKTVKRAPKLGRNIERGTFVKVPACRKVKFAASRQLQERIDRHEVPGV